MTKLPGRICGLRQFRSTNELRLRLMTHGTRPLPPGELEGEESQCHHRADEHAFLSGWTALQHGYIDLKSSALWPAVVFSTVRRKWDNQHLSNSGELHKCCASAAQARLRRKRENQPAAWSCRKRSKPQFSKPRLGAGAW